MTPSASFQGFEDRAKGAMFVVTELSVQSYAKVLQDFAPEQMQAGGMEQIAREKIPLSGGEGLLVVVQAGIDDCQEKGRNIGRLRKNFELLDHA